MATPPDFSAVADEIMEALWNVMPADECELGELLDGLCRQIDEFRQKGACECATECCETGQRLIRQLCDSASAMTSRFGQGFILMQHGTVLLTSQKLEPTLECFRQAMVQFQSCNRQRSQSVAWMAIGQAHWLTEDWEEAMHDFQQSLTVLKGLRPTDLTTIELRERVEKKLKQAQSAFVTHISNRDKKPRRHTHVSYTPILQQIPIVGTIAAGATEVVAEDNIEGYLLLGEEQARNAKFAVRVQGQSMIEDGILEHDLAMIKEQPEVDNGTTAAVLILAEGEAEPKGMLKHYYRENDHHRLEPRNAIEPTIVVIPVRADVDRITTHYRQQGKRISPCLGEARVVGKLVGIFREVN